MATVGDLYPTPSLLSCAILTNPHPSHRVGARGLPAGDPRGPKKDASSLRISGGIFAARPRSVRLKRFGNRPGGALPVRRPFVPRRVRRRSARNGSSLPSKNGSCERAGVLPPGGVVHNKNISSGCRSCTAALRSHFRKDRRG